MARVWHGEYWRAKKDSPWMLIILALVVLWVWGHTSGVKDTGHSAHRPAASAGASTPARH